MSKAIIPSTITPKDLAEETGWSERFIREKARALNACLGRNRGMRLTQEDVLKIMEARRCPSRSKSAAKYTTTQVRLPYAKGEKAGLDIVAYVAPHGVAKIGFELTLRVYQSSRS